MTCCWWRLTQPARVASSTRKGVRLAFIGRSYPEWGTGKDPAEFSDTTGPGDAAHPAGRNHPAARLRSAGPATAALAGATSAVSA
jgi:hypothetical protein